MKWMRKWATPVTAGSFVLMAVTGVLMFFHLDSGLNKLAHEWLGWAMLVGVVAHLVVNWRAFSGYFSRPLAQVVMAGFAGVLALSFWPVAGGGSPVAAAMQGLSRAPVERVIALTGEDTAAGFKRLRGAGVDAAPGQTIRALAGGDRNREGEILQLIFDSPG